MPLFGSYYGPGGSGSTVATGSATLTYDASQTLRSMKVAVSNVHLPDGMIMRCVITDNGLTEPGPYYPVEVPQLIGNPILAAGKASISGSTANGDNVPLFGTVGTITVHKGDHGACGMCLLRSQRAGPAVATPRINNPRSRNAGIRRGNTLRR